MTQTLPDRPKAQEAHPMVAFKRDLEAVVTREMEMLDDKAKARMRNALIVAATKNPEILMADRSSVFMAARMCAAHGVVPDGIEATIQVYNTKAKGPGGKEVWIKKATYLPMVRGIVNRVLRSGKVKLFWAEVVYDGEQFSIDVSNGDRRPVHVHDPMRRGTDEQMIGAYSVAKFADGTVDCEPMTRDDIMKVRAVAKTKDVWDGWLAEKAQVAAMKRHSKRLPMSAEDLEFILNRDETDFEQARDVTPAVSPRLAAMVQRARGQEPEPDVTLSGEAEPHWTEAVDTSPGCPGSAAWDRGVEAAQAGEDRTSCPFDADPEAAADWLAAFDQAQRAAE